MPTTDADDVKKRRKIMTDKPTDPLGVGRKRVELADGMLVYHRKRRDKNSPRYLLKCCGGYHNSLEIYYDDHAPRMHLEIGGVHGTLEDWKKVLLPLLEGHKP